MACTCMKAREPQTTSHYIHTVMVGNYWREATAALGSLTERSYHALVLIVTSGDPLITSSQGRSSVLLKLQCLYLSYAYAYAISSEMENY